MANTSEGEGRFELGPALLQVPDAMVKTALEMAAAKAGERYVADVTSKEMTKLAVEMATRRIAGQTGLAALGPSAGRALENIAASKVAAETAVKVAGRAASLITAPAMEMIALKRDDEEHTGSEYAAAAAIGAGSAGAGMLAAVAADAAACALVGSAVPVVGTIAGAVVGILAGALFRYLRDSQ